MFLLIDKPKGITSHDVIDELRKITGIRKIGHAGTLDPNATGLLIVGIGRESTKKLGSIAKDTFKTYEAEIYLGEERDTDDSEGKVVGRYNQGISQQARSSHVAKSVWDDHLKRGRQASVESLLTPSNVEMVLNGFVGEQEQLPPAYSAIKIKGKKAYELARKGKKLDLKPRKITIHSIELLDYKFPILKIEAVVSSGTYIRALARDVGRKLECGAYLRNLKRTEIGEYSIKDTVKIKQLGQDNWERACIDIVVE